MRGTDKVRISFIAGSGIIPAYAGNRTFTALINGLRRDHPRVCGEQAESHTQSPFKRGSSPRMRGTGRKRLLSNQRRGIIPAYAGNRFCQI